MIRKSLLFACLVLAAAAAASAAAPQDGAPFGEMDPLPSATLAGRITLTGWALGTAAIDRVEVWSMEYPWGIEHGHGLAGYGLGRADVDAAHPGLANSSGPGWSVEIDTRLLANGDHGFVAMAVDVAGRRTRLGALRADVMNPGDTIEPLGAVTFPTAGAVVSGRIEIAGWVVDETGAWGHGAGVLIDGHWLASPSGADGLRFGHATPEIAAAHPTYPGAGSAGWSYLFDTRRIADGPHTLVVYSRGTSVGTTEIGRVAIVVDNSIADTPPQVNLSRRLPRQWAGELTLAGNLLNGEIASAKLIFPGFAWEADATIPRRKARATHFERDFSILLNVSRIPAGCYQSVLRVVAHGGQVSEQPLGSHCVGRFGLFR